MVLRPLDKTYALNGDYKFSPSGTYEAAFMQDDNPGVKYEYLLPVSSNSESVEDFLDDGPTAEGDYEQTNSEEN